MDQISYKLMFEAIAVELMERGDQPYSILEYLKNSKHSSHRLKGGFLGPNGREDYYQVILNTFLSEDIKTKEFPHTIDNYSKSSNDLKKAIYGLFRVKEDNQIDLSNATDAYDNGVKEDNRIDLSNATDAFDNGVKEDNRIDLSNATDAYDKKYLGLLQKIFGEKPQLSSMSIKNKSQLSRLIMVITKIDADYARPQFPSYLEWPLKPKKASVDYQPHYHVSQQFITGSSNVNYLDLFDELKSQTQQLLDKSSYSGISRLMTEVDNLANQINQSISKNLESGKNNNFNALIRLTDDFSLKKKKVGIFLNYDNKDCNIIKSFNLYIEVLYREHYALGQRRLFEQTFDEIPDKSIIFKPFLKQLLSCGGHDGYILTDKCKEIDPKVDVSTLIEDGERFLKFYDGRNPRHSGRPIEQKICFERIASIMILFERKRPIKLQIKLPKYSKNDIYGANVSLKKHILKESNSKGHTETINIYWEKRFEYYLNSLIGSADLDAYKSAMILQASISSCVNTIIRTNLLIDPKKLSRDIDELISLLGVSR